MLVRWVLVLSEDMLTLDETNRPIAQCVTRFAACIPASCSSVRSHSHDFRRGRSEWMLILHAFGRRTPGRMTPHMLKQPRQ